MSATRIPPQFGTAPSIWSTIHLAVKPTNAQRDWALRSIFDERPILCRFLDAGVTAVPLGPAAGVQKAPRHEVAGRFGRRGCSQRYGDLTFTPVMVVGAELAPGDLDRVWSGAWKRATGIAVVAWSVSTGRSAR